MAPLQIVRNGKSRSPKRMLGACCPIQEGKGSPKEWMSVMDVRSYLIVEMDQHGDERLNPISVFHPAPRIFEIVTNDTMY
jgi:hypothetical protein